MNKIKNKGTVPQGMLAPSGYIETFINPAVQATVRPAGVLLPPSPGYDSVRVGKNRFQGKGPTGGFREMRYAEDIGGTGATLAVIPGDTSQIEASEWLPESPDSFAEGAMIISDRGRSQEPGFAGALHEAYNTIPDMGDRGSNRARSRANWMVHPGMMLRKDWQENPAMTVLAAIALIGIVHLVARDVERQWRSGRSIAADVTAPPAAAAAVTGDTASDAIKQVGQAADDAVKAIEAAGNKAVSTIESTAKTATGGE